MLSGDGSDAGAHGQSPRALHISRNMQNFDALIVGGGLTGPVTALALAQAGLSVCVVDALAEKVRKTAGVDGRSYAVALTSCRLLQ